MDEITSPEFLNMYLEMIWNDIQGKNKELILLKTNNKLLQHENDTLNGDLERYVKDYNDQNSMRETYSFELDQATIKINKLEADLKIAQESWLTTKQNYSLVVADCENAKSECNTLRLENNDLKLKLQQNNEDKIARPEVVSVWEEGSMISEPKPDKGKRKKN